MEKHLKDLTEIRSLMERSSKFLSLSGLSGIFPGLLATMAGIYTYFKLLPFDNNGIILFNHQLKQELLIIGIALILLSLSMAFYFTNQKVKKTGQSINSRSSKRLLVSLAIPLVAGGLFCLILLKHAPQIIDSATLIFYGLALLNASKYTLEDIKAIGYIEIGLGLLAGFINQWNISILIWILGFGIVHIVYGIIMYRKYDMK